MYHALFEGSDLSRIDAEDRPYAVEREAFARQLDAVAERLARVGDGPAVVLSFDDGHASNVDIALPLLVERGLEALFFVTSGFVGAREHFVDADMLRALVAAGMTVGGHGRTHRFFDDLAPHEALAEMRDARAALESATGVPVRSMSFPGGRHDARALRLAREAGVDALFDSRCATASPPELIAALEVARHDGAATGGGAAAAPVPRVAIRRDTDPTTFARMIAPDPAWYSAARRGERIRQLARRVLGNRIYHGLYKSLRAG